MVARFVLLEDFRRDQLHVRLDEPRGAWAAAVHSIGDFEPDEASAAQEQRLGCLDWCLEQLKPDQRDLVIEYDREVRRLKIERRRELARRLGISMNALGIRACRIRAVLETCVEGCCRPR